MKTTQQLYKALYSAIRSGGMYGVHKAFQSAIDECGLAYALDLSFKVERIHCRRNRETYPYGNLNIRLTTYKYEKRQKAKQVTICTDDDLDLICSISR
ncbi:hypothetical protein GNP63_01370 [Aliivibrio fischeri]|uniref:hypothetical protein n=1 Tax=Aliivibrio fischeri TaxID=668 RepID=UPI0012D88A8F|nr:hypothetical protein [Aliivibrio fischeri]MUH95201.1 hypothetical protein [Aliivibrio fischeri]MUI65111.1 hypothetical protein [Aliivibrio fischeri]